MFASPLALIGVLLSGCGGGSMTTMAPTAAPFIITTTNPADLTTKPDDHTTDPTFTTTFTTTTTTSGNSGKLGDPGGFISVSESVLDRGADHIATSIVSALRNVVIKGQRTPAFDFDDLHFEEVIIGSSDVEVIASEGVRVSLQDMSNKIAPVPFCVHDLLRLAKCCGTLWASASGQRYTAMNTVVVNETGWGHLVTTTPPHGFSVGEIQVHHRMNGTVCELMADAVHLVDSVVIGLVSKALEVQIPGIVAKAIDTPANLILYGIENPPALGFGEEKFKLDNTFVRVDYNDHRITHYNKCQFKSTKNPRESLQVPHPLHVSSERDVALGFSDYSLNTLFEAFYIEHMFEQNITLPFLHTPEGFFLCSDCPVEVKITFNKQAEARFIGNRAQNIIRDVQFAVGMHMNTSDPIGDFVAPIVTLAVDATASMEFELLQPDGKLPTLKATISLESFNQRVVATFIGDITIPAVTRLTEDLLNSLLDKINKAVPALPIPAIAGVKLDNPAFVVDNDQLVVLADLVQARVMPQIVV